MIPDTIPVKSPLPGEQHKTKSVSNKSERNEGRTLAQTKGISCRKSKAWMGHQKPPDE